MSDNSNTGVNQVLGCELLVLYLSFSAISCFVPFPFRPFFPFLVPASFRPLTLATLTTLVVDRPSAPILQNLVQYDSGSSCDSVAGPEDVDQEAHDYNAEQDSLFEHEFFHNLIEADRARLTVENGQLMQRVNVLNKVVVELTAERNAYKQENRHLKSVNHYVTKDRNQLSKFVGSVSYLVEIFQEAGHAAGDVLTALQNHPAIEGGLPGGELEEGQIHPDVTYEGAHNVFTGLAASAGDHEADYDMEAQGYEAHEEGEYEDYDE